MRIEFAQEGGLGYFPGLNKAVTIEVDRLDAGEAEELKQLVEASHFFDTPSAIGAPAQGRLIINTMSSPLRIVASDTPCVSSSRSRI